MKEPALYLRFSDPSVAPDWPGRSDPDRPRWNPATPEQRAAFVTYCCAQLDELDRRVSEQEAQRTNVEMLTALWHADAARRQYFALFREEIGMTQDEFDRRRRRYSEEIKSERVRPGPNLADQFEREQTKVARSAQDIAKLRYVIFPRVWQRKNRERAPFAEGIAAQRHGCDERAIVSWYENEKIVAKWRKPRS